MLYFFTTLAIGHLPSLDSYCGLSPPSFRARLWEMRTNSCDSDSPFIERIIRVAASVESVKRVTIVSIQRQSEPDALWQVRIRDEMPSEGDQIRIAVSNSSLGGIRFKTTRRDDLSRENL